MVARGKSCKISQELIKAGRSSKCWELIVTNQTSKKVPHHDLYLKECLE